MYLRIEEDGGLTVVDKDLKAEPDHEVFAEIEAGTLTVVRFRVFSPEAARVAGKPGIFEELTAESSAEEGDEVEGVDVETEPAVTWETSWEPI